MEPEGVALKVCIHLAVGAAYVDHSDRQQNEQRQEDPNEQAEGPQAMAAGKVIGCGGFVRRIIVRIDIEKAKAVWRPASIGDSQPDRLDAAPRHVYAKEAVAFLHIEHSHGHVNIALSLALCSLMKASIVFIRRVTREQPIQDWDSGEWHGGGLSRKRQEF